MTQELVTARDVAAPAVTLDFLEAQSVCNKLDEGLSGEGYRRAAYSADARSLFQLAWAVASHKQSTQVTVYHLAYALVCAKPEAGRALAEHLKSDADALAVGCIIRILNLGVSTGDAKIRPPAVGTARWVGDAVALARKRGQPSELLPDDLVRTVVEGRLHHAAFRDLKSAARIGNYRNGVVLGPKRLPAPTTPTEIVKHLEMVQSGPAEAGSDSTDLVEMLEAFEDRYGADADDQRQALSRIEQLIEKRLASGESQAMPIDDVVRRLDTIDRSVSFLGETLPRPPSGTRLAAAIVAVLALGVATGLVLTYWPAASHVAQASAATAK